MKETIRRELRDNLTAMKDGLRQELSERACKSLLGLEEYRQAKTVMAYIPLPDELDVSLVLRSAWEQGKVVATPRIVWERHSKVFGSPGARGRASIPLRTPAPYSFTWPAICSMYASLPIKVFL